jgi:glutathione S-transferase
MSTLVSIAYSPWSLRARLALDEAGVDVRIQPYLPGLSEPGLRWRLGRWRGPVTVPVLFREHAPPLTDSLDIARWADAQGGATLFPDEDAVLRWCAWSDRALAAGRRRTTRRALADPVALRASLPPAIAALGPLGMVIGRDAARRLLRKYASADEAADDAADLDALEEALEELATAVSTRPFLVGDHLSYADLTAAMGLSFVRPHADHPLSAPARRAWTEPALAAAYGPLLAWRDRILDGRLRPHPES